MRFAICHECFKSDNYICTYHCRRKENRGPGRGIRCPTHGETMKCVGWKMPIPSKAKRAVPYWWKR